MYTHTRHIILLSAVFIVLLSSAACVSTKNSVYFNGLTDTAFVNSNVLTEPVIQKNDLLSISISSLSEEATMIFNDPNNKGIRSTTATGNSVDALGYLVNADGNVSIPMLGNITAAGLTKSKLQQQITKDLVDKKLLKEPVVNVRFLNFKVTVLGEVGKPGVIAVPSEKISLFEAIGLAGDLTIYGKRTNVLIVREEETQKTTKRINLNSNELFTSPYYYLKPNDVVYVEPNKNKVANSSRALQWIPVITSTVSLGIIIFSRM